MKFSPRFCLGALATLSTLFGYGEITYAAAPTVVSPYNSEVIYISSAETYPTITGTADAGSAITARKNGAAVCTTTANSSGQWSCQSTVAFAPGTYAISAISLLEGVTQESEGLSCVIITARIATPVIVSPYNNEVLYITGTSIYPTITGTATAGTSITVKKDGSPVCTTTTNSSGQWSCQSTVAFTPGAYPLTAVSILGNQSVESVGISCVIITYVPPATHIVPTMNQLSNVYLECPKSSTTDVYFSGNGTPGATITVRNSEGVIVVSSQVNSSGAWWATSNIVFLPGTYTFTVTSTLGSNVLTGQNSSFTVYPSTKCTPTLSAPYIAPVASVNLACGQTATTVALSGTGVPGSTVYVWYTDWSTVGSATVTSNGTWSFTPTRTFGSGSHTLYTSTSYPNSNNIIAGNSRTFTISPASNCTPTHKTPTIYPSPLVLACDPSDLSSLGFYGIGTPGASISIKNASGTTLATAIVATNGTWWASLVVSLVPGTYPVTVSSTLGSDTLIGNTLDQAIRAAENCTPSLPAPYIAPVASVNLACGQTSTTVTLSGTGTPGATLSVWYSDWSTVGSTTVGSNGTWSFTPTRIFESGSHTFHTSTVLSSNPSNIIAGNSRTFTISPASACHSAPTLIQVNNINLACNQTSTNNVYLSGNGTPGATITIRNASGTVVGSSQVNGSGAWWVTSTAVFAIGSHTLTATSLFGTSLEVLRSNSMAFSVSGATNCAPAHTPPLITTPPSVTLSCSQSSATLPTLSGTGTPGASVSIKNASGTTLATALVGANGSWSVVPTGTFLPGNYPLTIESNLSGQIITGNTVSVTVNPATNCGPTHTPPVITTPPSVTLSCGESTRSLTLSGSGTVGATVTITNGSGTTIGTATIGSNGTWTVSTTTAPGKYSYTVSSTLGSSTIIGNTVSMTTSPAVNCGPIHTVTLAAIASQTLSCGSTATLVNLSGSGIVGATISVRDAANSTLATSTVNASGSWSATTTSLLSAATYTLTVSSTLGSSSITGNTQIFTISPATNCGGGVTHTPPVITTPPSVTLSCGESTRSLTLSGSGTVGATVTITNGSGTTIGTATIGSNGTWTVSTTTAPGTYSYTVSSTLGSSTIIGNTVSMTTSPAVNCAPVHVTPTISVSNAIVSCGQGSSVLVITGTASSGATISMRNNQGSVLGTVVATASGTYSFTTQPILLGTHSFSVSSTLGNSTLSSGTATATITQTSCGGGGSSVGPGGYTPAPSYPMIPLSPVPTPIVVTPKPPVITITVKPKGKTTLAPYWERFPEVVPEVKFLGTGPSANLTKKTSIRKSVRIQTSDDRYTAGAQIKVTKRFETPLLSR